MHWKLFRCIKNPNGASEILAVLKFIGSVMIPSAKLAQIAVESPEFKKLFFPGPKERPTEAPFGAWKKSFLDEDLEQKAGWAPENKLIS